MKKINAFVVATLILLFLATSAPAPTKTYRAGILTVNRWLRIYASGYLVNSGYYEQVYEGNVADAFKVDYRGTGYKILNLRADGVTVLELTKTGALGLTGYMDIDQGTFPTGLVFSGTVDQDNQKAMSFTSSADTDFDNTWGIRGTVNTGTGTLSDQGGILLRESIGAQFDVTSASDHSVTDWDYAYAMGVKNVIKSTGKQTQVYGVYNDIQDVSGGDWNLGCGVFTQAYTGVTVSDDRTIYALHNFLNPQTVNNNSSFIGLHNQIYGYGVVDGAVAYGTAVNNDLVGSLYGTSTGTAIVYGTSSMFRSRAGDVGYDYYSGTDLYSASTGGTRYGYYVDMTDTDVTRWSVYVTPSSGDSYFGPSIGIGSTSPVGSLHVGDQATNYTTFASDGTQTLVGTAKVTDIVRLPLENFRKGVTAPTETIKGNTAGFLFDADAEILYIQYCVPKKWDQASDHILRLFCVLNQAETANDDIDWETITTPAADHENVLTANTQTPGVNHDIGSVNADGDLHKVDVTLDYDDGSAPIATGDIVWIALSRTSNVGQPGYVGGVLLTDVCLVYICDRLGE